MKINKEAKKLFEAKLFEADDKLGVLDTSDSVDALADEIADHIETSTEGDLTISDAEADKLAAEIKDTAASLEIETAAVDPGGDIEYLGVENVITKTLDMALLGALKNKRRGGKFGNNVLIVGLPGSGKTATIYDWAHANNINLVSVNSKNNDLDAYINGYTTRDPDKKRRVTQAYSDNLAGLDEPRSVLFLDEYNRQVKPQIRASLLTLINEHKIVGDGPNGQHEFKNMLFTIAAINPAVATDKGAAELNDAEKTRFVHKLKNMDSDPATTIEFLTKYFDKKINNLDPADEYYKEDLEEYLRIQDLGIFIMAHPKFDYDTRADLDDIALNQATMLNQRSFVEGLNAANGDVDAFKLWVEHSSDFLEHDIEMLLAILKEYIKPSFEDLCTGHGIDPSSATPPHVDSGKPKEPETEEPADTGADLEDDDDFFTDRGRAGTVRAKNPYEVELAIANALKEW